MIATAEPGLPVYDFGDILAIRVRERVGMSEGFRLQPDCPNRWLLRHWCVEGRKPRGLCERFKLPSFIGPGGKRYTTVAAYTWWVFELNLLAGETA